MLDESLPCVSRISTVCLVARAREFVRRGLCGVIVRVNNGGMEIRRATVNDAAGIAALGAYVQELHHARHPEWFKPANVAEGVALYESVLVGPDVVAFVAVEGVEVIGYVLVTVSDRAETPRNWHHRMISIDEIGVAPQERRRGRGRQLIEAVRDLAHQVSADRIELTTWDFNTDAHRFFEAQGLTSELRRMSMPWPPSRPSGPQC